MGTVVAVAGAPNVCIHAVAMVIEVQLYLDQFLQFRKLVHPYYKITRAQNLASLAQDCRKFAKNPALAFDTQKQVDADAADAAVALLAAVGAGDSITPLAAGAANLNVVFEQSGKTALLVALEAGHGEVFEQLIAAGADLKGKTELMYASEVGHSTKVGQLIAAGAEVNAVSTDGMTARMLASHAGHTKVVDLLVAGGANANRPVARGRRKKRGSAQRNGDGSGGGGVAVSPPAAANVENGAAPSPPPPPLPPPTHPPPPPQHAP